MNSSFTVFLKKTANISTLSQKKVVSWFVSQYTDVAIFDEEHKVSISYCWHSPPDAACLLIAWCCKHPLNVGGCYGLILFTANIWCCSFSDLLLYRLKVALSDCDHPRISISLYGAIMLLGLSVMWIVYLIYPMTKPMQIAVNYFKLIPKRILGNLSTGVSEPRTATKREAFSLLARLDAITFVNLQSVFTLIETLQNHCP